MFRQGYCQYGNRCHFLHTRPNLVNIVPDQEEKINTGNYELFKKEEVAKVTRRITLPILHTTKSGILMNLWDHIFNTNFLTQKIPKKICVKNMVPEFMYNNFDIFY